VLVYDSDEAGRTAAERTLDILLPAGLEIRVALLPEGRDVDEILLEDGVEAFEAVLTSALDVLAFKLHALGARHDLQTPRGRAQASESLVRTIVKVPSPVERDQLLRAVAEELGGVGTEDALRREAANVLHEAVPRARAAAAARTETEPLSRAARVLVRTQRVAEEFLLAGLLFHPELRPSILRAVGAEDFEVPANRRILEAVQAAEDAGVIVSITTIGGRLADDEPAQAVLAGLDTDETLEDRIPFQIEFLERRRLARRRALQIRRDLGDTPDFGSTHPHPTSDIEASPEARSQDVDVVFNTEFNTDFEPDFEPDSDPDVDPHTDRHAD
jgi:DNA primase